MANERMRIDDLELEVIDVSTPEAIEERGKRLIGMTFRDVLELGISPKGVNRQYNNKRYKGGMGTLIEERFYGYKANSDDGPDFEEAGVELKTTCLDVKANGEFSAGERLSLTMIPYNREISDDLYQSHLWKKNKLLMLVYYRREKDIDGYDQRIEFAQLFTPPPKDLRIIEDDYAKIVGLIKEGKAEELSESLTVYLGASTKGASAESSYTEQFYPPHSRAKKRSFCFKRPYMDYVLHHYFMGEPEEDEIVKDDEVLSEISFEEYVRNSIDKHVGKTDKQLCREFGLTYTKNKAQWTTLTYRMLGLNGESSSEFKKAGISVRTVRVDEGGKSIEQSLSLSPFEFMDLVEEDWEDSQLREYLEETRFFFVVFENDGDDAILRGCKFWNMPRQDREGALRTCWEETKKCIIDGVELTRPAVGEKPVRNNLPKISREGSISHVRPHANHAAYIFEDGTIIGDPQKDASELPDGRWMTRQSFWLNNHYIYEIVSDICTS